jgi:voltage-gated potassium channel
MPGGDTHKDITTTQGPLVILGLLVFVLVAGTVGYVWIEGWTVWDAFYMTIITITTVGYGEVHPLSRAGQEFTSVLLIVGVGTALYAFGLSASVIAEGGIFARFKRRRYRRMLDELTDHYIICGFGRIGSVIVEELRRQNIPYVVIDRDAEQVAGVMEIGGLAVEADASREEVLKRVGIDKAKAFIAAVGTDAENVYAVLTARGLRPDIFIVGRAETADAVRKLKRAGADRVVSPYKLGAVQMAQTALRPAVVDFMELATSSKSGDLGMEQIHNKEGSLLANRSIIETNLRQKYGLIVVGIQRAKGQMEFNPAADAVMRVGDHLVVLGPRANLSELEAVVETTPGA